MPLHKTLYAHAFAILRDENDAADCLQEAFTRLWSARDKLDSLQNPAAYAVVTVRNLAVNMLSRARPVAFTGDDLPDIADTSPTPESDLAESDSRQLLNSLLQRLPDNQRKVVELSALSGLTNNEIKTATGLSDENVRVLLSRGRRRLRDLFIKFSSI